MIDTDLKNPSDKFLKDYKQVKKITRGSRHVTHTFDVMWPKIIVAAQAYRIAKNDLEFVILLPLTPKFWDYRSVLPECAVWSKV